MANQKLRELSTTATMAQDDILYTVVDPAGVPSDRQITLANLEGSLDVSAAEITATGSVTARTAAARWAEFKNPLDEGVLNDGATNGQVAMQALLDRLVDGDTVKFSPGTYLFTWDGVTGDGVGSGANTGINRRTTLKLSGIDNVTIDFGDAKILMGGIDWTEWATMFYIHDCKNFEVKGGTFDFLNLPYYQGNVTSKSTTVMDVLLDSGTPAPSFVTAWEVVSYNGDKPINIQMDQNPFSETAWTVALLSGSTYRLTIVDAADQTALLNNIAVNDKVIVKGMTDGGHWFKFADCENVKISNPMVHVGLDAPFMGHKFRNFDIRGARFVRRPETSLLGTTMRGAIRPIMTQGTVTINGNIVERTGDDGVDIAIASLDNMAFVSSTSFTADGAFHGFGMEEDVGDTVIIYDSDTTEVANLTIVTITDPGASRLNRTYTVTVNSGAIPSPLTNHYAVIPEWTPEQKVQNNTFRFNRARGIFIPGPCQVTGNTFEGIPNEAVLVEEDRTLDTANFGLESYIQITDNRISECASALTRAAPIVVRRHQLGLIDTSDTWPLKGVKIHDNLIRIAPHMAILVGGAQYVSVRGNTCIDISSDSNQSSYWTGLGNTMIGLINVKDVHVDGNDGYDTNSAVAVKAITDGAGTNVNILEGKNPLFNASIDTDGTFTPTVTFAIPGDFSPTYTTQLGFFKKEGKTVRFSFHLNFDTNAYTTASGALRVASLPFTSANDGVRYALSIGRMSAVTLAAAYDGIVAAVPANVAYVQFQSIESATSGTNFGTTEFPASTNNFILECTGIYFID